MDLDQDLPQIAKTTSTNEGENFAFWLFEQTGKFALLNCHLQIEAVAQPSALPDGIDRPTDYEHLSRRAVFSARNADSEVLADWTDDAAFGSKEVAGAGWRFTCQRQFEHWHGTYSGTPLVTSEARLYEDRLDTDGTRGLLACAVDLVMAAAPWFQGDFVRTGPGNELALRFIGVPRYEQLFRFKGELRWGNETRLISGTGLRTHRWGRRDIGSMTAHVAATAIFPSGRAFGLMEFLDGGDAPFYSEAFVLEDATRELAGAKVERSPWLSKDRGYGNGAIRLRVGLREIPIKCDVVGSTWSNGDGLGLEWTSDGLAFCHAICRYVWDGEIAYGLLDRSTLKMYGNRSRVVP